MALSELLLPEFDQEMTNTRKTLERIPEDKLGWKPHEKSFSMGDLAIHLAEMPGWAQVTLEQDSFDVNPPGGHTYQRPKLGSRQEILEMFDKNLTVARTLLEKASDEQFQKPWSLLNGGKVTMTMPRIAVFRNFIMNHNIHHRAQLGVYLRLNDVPVPAIYGPSADEGGM
ncbi:MAG: DinB family protein [Acidobacteria bacterium]|nr:DinB family protein [Acidobacteriota bacterium]